LEYQKTTQKATISNLHSTSQQGSLSRLTLQHAFYYLCIVADNCCLHSAPKITLYDTLAVIKGRVV